MGRKSWDRGRWDEIPHSDLLFRSDLFWAKVDKSGECWEWTGSRNPNGYGSAFAREHDGSRTTARPHRVAYLTHVGPIPEGMEVDHTCHNRACLNPGHLRLVTTKQNQENRGHLDARNKSGYRGVTWSKTNKSWVAAVSHHGQRHYVGHFSTAKEAGEAARLKRLELFTHNDIDRKQAAA